MDGGGGGVEGEVVGVAGEGGGGGGDGVGGWGAAVGMGGRGGVVGVGGEEEGGGGRPGFFSQVLFTGRGPLRRMVGSWVPLKDGEGKVGWVVLVLTPVDGGFG